ncbi:MAG TPA: hypothetical protein VIU93_09080 [Gallionellaceae bacterium]
MRIRQKCGGPFTLLREGNVKNIPAARRFPAATDQGSLLEYGTAGRYCFLLGAYAMDRVVYHRRGDMSAKDISVGKKLIRDA